MNKLNFKQWLFAMAIGVIAAIVLLFACYSFGFTSSFTYFLAIALTVVTLVIVGSAEMGWKYFAGVLAFLIFCLTIAPITAENADIARVERDKKISQDWIDASCPVYKGECGSKAKYACEIKVSTVGRIDLGDSFVQSYPTCAK